MKKLHNLLLIFIILLTYSCKKTESPVEPLTDSGKWDLIAGPYGASVYSIALKQKEIFLGTDRNLYKSTDGGSTWSMNLNDFSTKKINALVYYKEFLFAATDTGFFKTSDGGTSWIISNIGLLDKHITSIAITGSEIYITTYKGIYKSTNDGAVWISVNKGLSNLYINTIFFSGTEIIAGTDHGLYKSTNGGNEWFQFVPAAASHNVKAISGLDSIYFLGSNEGVFKSLNRGNSWDIFNTGLERFMPFTIRKIMPADTFIYLATDKGLFRTSRKGTVWQYETLPVNNILTISTQEKEVYVGLGETRGAYKGAIGSKTYTSLNKGINNFKIQSIYLTTKEVFVGTNFGFFKSTNNGSSWSFLDSNLYTKDIRVITKIGSDIIAGSYGDGLYKLGSGGLAWVQSGLKGNNIISLAAKDYEIFAGTTEGVFKSSDSGLNWETKNNGISNKNINTIAIYGTEVFAGTNGGCFKSTDGGNIWFPSNSGLTSYAVNSLCVIKSNLIAATNTGIFRSTNRGSNWFFSGEGIGNNKSQILTASSSGNELFASTFEGLFKSTDEGVSWININNGITNDKLVISFFILGTTIYAGTNDGGFFKGNNFIAK